MSKPEIIEVWAPWCAPCTAMEPILAELAERHAGEVTLTRVDASTETERVAELRVRAVPTFVVMHDGVELGRLTGALDRAGLERLFTEAAAGRASRRRLSGTDRLLRLGAAAALGVAAVLTGTPILGIVAAGVGLSGFWDLVRR